MTNEEGHGGALAGALAVSGVRRRSSLSYGDQGRSKRGRLEWRPKWTGPLGGSREGGRRDDQGWTEAKDPAAVSLVRHGGLKRGRARATRRVAEQRAEIARQGARARWANRTGAKDT